VKDLLQYILDGLSIGSVYALITLGIVVIYRGTSNIKAAGQNRGKFFTTEAAYNVGCAHIAAHGFRKDAQRLVAHLMAEAIVDRFEMIEIEHQKGDLLTLSRLLFDQAPRRFLITAPIVQSSEQIGDRSGLVQQHHMHGAFCVWRWLGEGNAKRHQRQQRGERPAESAAQARPITGASRERLARFTRHRNRALQSRRATVEHPSTDAECRVKNRKRPQRMRKNTGYHKGHEH
jgi:hypothetical protein